MNDVTLFLAALTHHFQVGCYVIIVKSCIQWPNYQRMWHMNIRECKSYDCS